jgi:hypothetical protein
LDVRDETWGRPLRRDAAWAWPLARRTWLGGKHGMSGDDFEDKVMAATSGLKTAVDRVSRMKDQPFKDKPVALQSAAGGSILGGSRAQYRLRQCSTSIDAILLGRPEARSAAAHAESGRGRRVRRPYEGSFFAIATFAPQNSTRRRRSSRIRPRST